MMALFYLAEFSPAKALCIGISARAKLRKVTFLDSVTFSASPPPLRGFSVCIILGPDPRRVISSVIVFWLVCSDCELTLPLVFWIRVSNNEP